MVDSSHEIDEHWMHKALAMASQAATQNEVPVGAVVIKQGQLIATGMNESITAIDPSAHAEIVALRAAAQQLGNYRLPGCEMYVTLEPCCMCAGALVHARLSRLVFAAYDYKSGVVSSHLSILDSPFLNHKIPWRGGVLESQAAQLLSEFFKQRRN